MRSRLLKFIIAMRLHVSVDRVESSVFAIAVIRSIDIGTKRPNASLSNKE